MEMARKKQCKVFVSYSRHDEALVKPLAGLLGAAADDAIFLDIESIKPGNLWKYEIEHAVRNSSVFILCWCCESERSQFVRYEIRMALEGKDKRLVPVLLCSTPLPDSLTDRQWVDLRGRIIHSCNEHGLKTESETEGTSQSRTRSQSETRGTSTSQTKGTSRSVNQSEAENEGDSFPTGFQPTMARSEGNVRLPPPPPPPPAAASLRVRKIAGSLTLLALLVLSFLVLYISDRPYHSPPSINSEQRSTVCMFFEGPRAGQMEDYAAVWPSPLPVGTRCSDGAGSEGRVMSRLPTLTSSPQGKTLLVGGWLLVFASVLVGLILLRLHKATQRWNRHREANKVASVATAYFEKLGQNRPSP